MIPVYPFDPERDKLRKLYAIAVKEFGPPPFPQWLIRENVRTERWRNLLARIEGRIARGKGLGWIYEEEWRTLLPNLEK